MNEKTKIYIMFRSTGRGHERDWDAEERGRILTNEEILNELEERCEGVWDNPGVSCRTKLAIETDTKALLENLDWQTFAQHRVVFYGDYREKFKDLATFIGFEVIEEDKSIDY